MAAASLFTALAGCATRVPSDLDARVEAAMRREHVVGLALALIDGGRVVHVRAFGRRDVGRDLPLDVDTVLYGASLTKAAFAYVVLQLVDEGRLDLDASVATLLPRPLPTYERWRDLADDDRWRRLTPRILLSHASGFANFRWLEPDRRLRFHADPGTRYAYSGEGLQLLQFVLEQRPGFDLGREMQTRLFDRFAMGRTAMTWRDDFAGDFADGHDAAGAVVPHARRSRADAAGSMDTTIADQARLWAAMVRGDGLSAASRSALVRAVLPITSAHQFPTLSDGTSTANEAIALSSALGVLTWQGVQGTGWYKGGHDEGTGNLAVCLERGRRCLVLLANDVRAERLFPELVYLTLGETSMRWAWEYGWLDAVER